jgi:V8-like Glu-specific endopeptidase
MKHNYSFLFISALTLFCFESVAQVQTRKTTSKDFISIVGHSEINETNIISLPALDMDKIRVEDAEDVKKGKIERFGRAIPLSVGLEAGKWHLDLSRGGHRWRLGVTAKQAKGLLINFDDFTLPKGAELYAFNAKKSILFGPVTHENSPLKGRFATDLINGDTIFLELFEPIQMRGKSKLHIMSILYAYDVSWQDQADDTPGTLLDCQRDVVCPEGNNVGAEMDAIAFIFDTQLGTSCSGTLLNNACNNLRPTLLTAKHCLDGGNSNPSNWSFRFRFRNSVCGGTNTTSYKSILGSSQVVSSPSTGSSGDVSTDALLVQLSALPSAQSGITYAGWSRGTNITAVTALHHPRKNPLKVSTAPAPTAVTNIVSTNPNTSVSRTITQAWQVDWALNMTTQAGSSGAGYFDQNHRVVGQHSAGQGACDIRQGVAGRFDVYWNEGFNVHLSDDPAVMQTNTVGVPSLTLPDAICGFEPLGINWNGITNMNFVSGTLVGVQGSNQGFGLEPIPNFSGVGFAELRVTPSGITCNTPLIIRKDFDVGLPSPQPIFQQDGPCYAFLYVNNPVNGVTYSWKVVKNGYTYTYTGPSIGFSNPSNNDDYLTFVLTASNGCGQTVVEGDGVVLACNGPLFQGQDNGISALMSKNYKPVLSISPNPATQEVTLNIKNISPIMLNTSCDVRVLNQMGQAVVNQKLILENAIRLDINSLANGFYVVQVKGENGLSLSQKLIVNKK